MLIFSICWEWQGPIDRYGYGRSGHSDKAHRKVYEAARGAIATGLELDHLCRNRRCVNPWHLEPVTKSENWRRGESVTAQNALRSTCAQGHQYDDTNTYRQPGTNRRDCRICIRQRARAYAARKKVA